MSERTSIELLFRYFTHSYWIYRGIILLTTSHTSTSTRVQILDPVHPVTSAHLHPVPWNALVSSNSYNCHPLLYKLLIIYTGNSSRELVQHGRYDAIHSWCQAEPGAGIHSTQDVGFQSQRVTKVSVNGTITFAMLDCLFVGTLAKRLVNISYK